MLLQPLGDLVSVREAGPGERRRLELRVARVDVGTVLDELLHQIQGPDDGGAVQRGAPTRVRRHPATNEPLDDLPA